MGYVLTLSLLLITSSLSACVAGTDVPRAEVNAAPAQEKTMPSQQPSPTPQPEPAQQDPAAGGRVALPSIEGCSPNATRYFSGEVRSFRRTDEAVEITLRTDWDSTKKLTQPAPNAAKIVYQFRGKAMKDGDWSAVEDGEGKVRPGMRAAVSVCMEDGKEVIRVINWGVPEAEGGRTP